MRAIHPGEILREELLEPLGITPTSLARALHVSTPRVNAIVLERRGVTADMAIRMGRYFATSPLFWMNRQSEYALSTTMAVNGEAITHEVEPLLAHG